MSDEELPFANEVDTELKDVQEHLRRAMRRVEAPRGFADSVLHAASTQESAGAPECGLERLLPAATPLHGRVLRIASFSSTGGMKVAWRAGLAAALLLVLLLPVAGYVNRQRQQARAEDAARQFTLAMRITRAALEDAGEHLASHSHARETER